MNESSKRHLKLLLLIFYSQTILLQRKTEPEPNLNRDIVFNSAHFLCRRIQF